MKLSTLLGFFAYIGGVEFFFRRIWLNFMAVAYPAWTNYVYKQIHAIIEGVPYWGQHLDALARTNLSDGDLVHYAAYGVVGLLLVFARSCGVETPVRWALLIAMCAAAGLFFWWPWPWVRPLFI